MEEAVGHRDVPIRRDRSFFRATADNAVIMHLGRDTEGAFLVSSPTPLTNRETLNESGEDDPMFSGIRIEPSYYEVARIRMAPESWLAVAVQIVSSSVESGTLKLEDFVEHVQAATSAQISEDGKIKR